MYQSGENIPNDTVCKTQVCIIGSGPAAVTLAWYLLDRGIDVLIAEGSRDTAVTGRGNENTLLYEGTVTGQFATNERQFLVLPINGPDDGGTRERERVYGGTSTHWGGQCRPLDPMVFAGRPGFPAWPITREDLDPSYHEAVAFMQLHGYDVYFGGPDHASGYNFTIDYWQAQSTLCERMDIENFEEAMYQFPVDDVLRFQTRTVGGVSIGDSDARVILNASLLHIVEVGGVVQHVEVSSMTLDPDNPEVATTFKVQAEVYVLACGAVENARQMLLSGVGNASDTVGRYLTGHPIYSGTGSTVSAYYGTNVNRTQTNTLAYQKFGHDDSEIFGISAIEGRMTPTAAVSDGLTRCRFSNTGGFYFELAPEADSRITLSDTDFDLFRQPRAVANWYVGSTQSDSYDAMTSTFATSVANLGGGARVTANDWSNVLPGLQFNGHHVGTTRMSSDPTQGVVDANLRVHGLANLYVAGSSTFTTAGVSNPTFTIIALSIRLAGHLADELGKTKGGLLEGLRSTR